MPSPGLLLNTTSLGGALLGPSLRFTAVGGENEASIWTNIIHYSQWFDSSCREEGATLLASVVIKSQGWPWEWPEAGHPTGEMGVEHCRARFQVGAFTSSYLTSGKYFNDSKALRTLRNADNDLFHVGWGGWVALMKGCLRKCSAKSKWNWEGAFPGAAQGNWAAFLNLQRPFSQCVALSFCLK